MGKGYKLKSVKTKRNGCQYNVSLVLGPRMQIHRM